jgi:hypothetical protein
MSYFDNLDNESQNKYKKNLKNRKKVYKCVLLRLDWWSFKFHGISLSLDSLSNFYVICNGFNLTAFDGLSNDNKITWRTHL